MRTELKHTDEHDTLNITIDPATTIFARFHKGRLIPHINSTRPNSQSHRDAYLMRAATVLYGWFRAGLRVTPEALTELQRLADAAPDLDALLAILQVETAR